MPFIDSRLVLSSKTLTGRGVLKHTRLALDFREGANREQVLYVCSMCMYVCSKSTTGRGVLNIHTWTSNIHTKLVHDLRPHAYNLT